ncbi:MAG: hypothetical protein KDD64_15110 [Bdellovibrionales bacterium]|nr:hypothetical protein [Bdellovibrionales bacterium]
MADNEQVVSKQAEERAEERSVGVSDAAAGTTHFWISTYPLVQSKLLLVPPQDCSATYPSRASLRIFDADGEIINEVQLVFESSELSVLEMEQYLEGCKLVQGMKQAHLEVATSPGITSAVRLIAGEASSFSAPLIELAKDDFHFLPVSFSENRSNFALLVNFGETEAEVKCRLYRDKRKPEELVRIPPHGTRVVALEVDFVEHAGSVAHQASQVYLRIGLRSGSRVGVQVLEQTQPSPRSQFYSTVS